MSSCCSATWSCCSFCFLIFSAFGSFSYQLSRNLFQTFSRDGLFFVCLFVFRIFFSGFSDKHSRHGRDIKSGWPAFVPCLEKFWRKWSRSILNQNPGRDAVNFWCLPPVWNLRTVGLIPLFYISSFVLLPKSCCSYSLILFCFWPILQTSFSLNIHFPKYRLFCVALGLFSGFFRAVRRCWWYVQHMLPYGTDISLYAFIYPGSIFNLRLFLSILFYNVLI